MMTIALFAVFPKAAHVTFTTYDQLDNISGYITANIDPSLGNAPFTVVIEGVTNGYYNETTIFGYDFISLALPQGRYCITITSIDGCTASQCMTINKCVTWKNWVLCLAVAELPKEKALLVAVDPPNIIGWDKELNLSVFTGLDPEKLDGMMDHVVNNTVSQIKEIKATGTSDHIVAEQNELESDAPYILKFQEDGTLEWVYFAGETNNDPRKEKLANKRGEEPENFIGSSEAYPNPFTHELILDTEVNMDGELTIDLHDIVGKIVQSYSFEVQEGHNRLTLDGLENLPAGLYNLVQYGPKGEHSSHKVMKVE